MPISPPESLQQIALLAVGAGPGWRKHLLLDKTEGLWCAGGASAVRATLLRGDLCCQGSYGGVGGVGWCGCLWSQKLGFLAR